MAALKYSRQREAIKNYLEGRKDHPTADMVYTAIREVYPNISLGTVYRNLTLLAKQGEISKISCGETSDRFDIRTDPHYHFICEKCGRVEDLPDMDMQAVNAWAGENYDGDIFGHQLYFYGRCRECREKEKN
ncbi:Fur family transcriptional regulator [Frisingicoccus sp.]|uniref:Fur family transcriptional regulator n=1 Tax=Frisingicoccus sp. TaxID=1918627 RepID=UPI003AB52F8F